MNDCDRGRDDRERPRQETFMFLIAVTHANMVPRLAPLARDGRPGTGQASRNPLFDSGSVRSRLPVAAKIALLTAGSTGGSAGSPRPVGGLLVSTKCTSISGGACRMRTG